jgi:ribonuclease D
MHASNVTLAIAPTLVLYDDLTSEAASGFAAADRLAWDIETSGLNWLDAKIATCQLYTPAMGVVVVQINGHRPTRLRRLLSDHRVAKVFHHAPFDLRFMVGHWDVHPANVKCTKVASKLIEPDLPADQHSLQALVRRLLGIELDKRQRRSDWMAQELSPEQLTYAANDVKFLLPLIDELERRASSVRLADLLQRCFDHLPTRAELEARGYEDIYSY